MIPATVSTNIDSASLTTLIPFRNLIPNTISKIIASARVHSLSRDENCLDIETADNHQWFLLKGTVTIHRQDKTVETFNDEDVAAKFPLHCGNRQATSITTSEHAELLCVPENMINDLESASTNDEANISVKEGGIEEEIYLEFYQNMKNSKLELPSMPDLAVRIMRTVDTANTNSDDIAKVIEFDASLSTRLVQTANSPLYAGRSKTTSVRDAITRLGRQTTRTLAVSFLLKNLYKTDSPLLKKRMLELWKHSANVAAISSILAKITPGLNPDQALMSGLLHDIGVIPILNNARHHPELIKHPLMLEKAITDLRAEIGIMTMIHWDLDESYHDIPRYADEYLHHSGNTPSYTDIVILAQMHSYIGTPISHLKNIPRIDTVPAFKKLALGKLTPKLSIAVLDKAKHAIDEVTQLLMK